jgi:uncharacterized protein (TIGR03083 family)
MTADVALPATEIPQTPPRVAAHAVDVEQLAALDLLSVLDPQDWERPTDCAGWTVRDLMAHMLGQYEGLASTSLMLKRLIRAIRRYPELSRLDAINRVQIEDVAALSPAQLLERLALAGPRAVRSLERTPAVLRRVPGLRLYGVGELPDQRLSYLWDVLVLRDPWMHRVDLCHATARPFKPTDHDAVVVEQVIRDLARAWHGPTVTLELNGVVSGRWTIGSGGSVATLGVDALAFCRLLSGRRSDEQLRVSGDPAAATALADARVVF